jgi:hypothetical protein
MPKSEVRLLRGFDELVPRIPERSLASVGRELESIRRAPAGRRPSTRRMILLDTSLLIDALTGPKPPAAALRTAIHDGARILLPALVLYE